MARRGRDKGPLSRLPGGGAGTLGDGRNRCFNPGAPCLLRRGFRALPWLPLAGAADLPRALCYARPRRHGCGRGPRLCPAARALSLGRPAILRLAVASGVPGRGRLRRGRSR
jgi:hypothetical protein